MNVKYESIKVGKYKSKGFTLIEIIITIVIWSILIIPLAFMVKEHIIGTATAADIVSACNLARLEMSKVNNLGYTDAALADGYNNTTTDYEGYNYDLNRSVSYVAGSTNNLKKVTVTVYESGTTRQLANLVTYVANVSVGAGSGGGAAGGGDADSLTVSGGSISGEDLQNVTLQNTSASSITIIGVTISFTGQSGIKLKEITMDGGERWEGNASSGATITFDTNFTLSANTTYTNTGLFEFSKNLTSVTSLVFIMSDGSETGSYSW